MRRKMGMLISLLIFVGIPLAVKAASEGNPDIKSCGSIIYKDSSGSIELYADDIALLQEKLASVPDAIFDPVLYSHMHKWEYININKNTHTKHCDGCGSSYDMISSHDEAASKACTITYGGKEYPGYEKTCICGYTWKEELYHDLIYSIVDASYHSLSCALDGTEYCSGLADKRSEHIRIVNPADKMHHQIICDYCGFEGNIENCVFDFGSAEDSEDPTRVQKYCECGNYITEPKETVSGNSTEDGSDKETQSGQSEPEKSASENHTEVMEKGGAK